MLVKFLLNLEIRISFTFREKSEKLKIMGLSCSTGEDSSQRGGHLFS